MNLTDTTQGTIGIKQRLKSAITRAVVWGDRHQMALAIFILLASAIPLLMVLDDPPQSDLHIYHSLATAMAKGKMPYKEHLFEYPPYAIPLFLLPSLLGDENYFLGFKLMAVLADALIKCLLLSIGLREAKGVRSLLPLAFYCFAIPFIKYFYLQRFDVFPALISVFAIVAFSSKRYLLSGLMVALGAGLKLYPALFVPTFLVLAWRKNKAKQFALGLLTGAAPILLLSFWLPWWRFFAFHGERGLQVESTYASIIWLAHHFGIGDVRWESGNRCFELHGALPQAVQRGVRIVFITAVTWASISSCRIAARLTPISASTISQLSLLSLLAFVGFNSVFSPQYLIWLLPLANAQSIGSKRKAGVSTLVSLATIFTVFIFPSPEYQVGITLPQTIILVLRNLLLLYCVASVIRASVSQPTQMITA